MALSMELIGAVLGISLMDLVLAGDNAIVIGMAAARLHGRQRKLAIILGGGAAIILRVSLTAAATILLQIPALKLMGGLLLLYIGFKLLKEVEEEHEHVTAAAGLRSAVITILMADFIMSTDNVLAVAALAHGDIVLLIFGLGLSIPLLMLGGGIIAELTGRMWWLAYVGSAAIAWTGGGMMVNDKYAHEALASLGLPDANWWFPTLTLVGVLGFAQWFHRRPSKVAARAKHASAISRSDAGEEALTTDASR
ncbi:MAG: YjbE family putative metal transport protein [Chloroflexi bacterium]|nr:YjbE family putative metal transport protein [Chloroflexota bacterium]